MNTYLSVVPPRFSIALTALLVSELFLVYSARRSRLRSLPVAGLNCEPGQVADESVEFRDQESLWGRR